MIYIDIDQVNLDWLSYLRRAEAGETVVITRDDQPIAELKPSKRRPIGLCEGEFEVPDDFDEPLPNIVSLFEGE